MAKKQLKIKLLPNGEIQMETVGIKGKKCLDYVQFLELLADVKIQKQEFTDEYYENEENVVYNTEEEIEDINF
jgi:hypothetical protein